MPRSLPGLHPRLRYCLRTPYSWRAPRCAPRALLTALLFSCAVAGADRFADAAPTPASPVPAGFGRALDTWAAPLVQAGELSGSLLIAHRDRIVLERSWGMAQRELSVPNGPETRFCVASITKPMTVILAIQEITGGRLAMQDSIARWFPDFPRGTEIRVEHLLRHRAGIPHRVTSDCEEIVPRTAEQMVAFAAKATPTGEPGATYQYSSGGFSVLARVLELTSGLSYAELLEARLFKPLGMRHSGHVDARQLVPGRAASYFNAGRGIENATLQDLSFLVGAGSVVMTARDLHRLLWAAGSGELGVGPRLSSLRGQRIAWNGSTNGFRAFAEFDTTTEVSVVFTGNLHSGAVDQLRAAVGALLARKAPDAVVLPPAIAATVPLEVLRRYEGRYDVANNPGLAVRATTVGLDVNGWTLMATSDTTFFSLRDYAPVTVVLGPDGKPTRLDWVYGAETLACPRVGDLEPAP